MSDYTPEENYQYWHDFFHKKRFTVDKTELTYRTINNWSEKGLISHIRTRKGKWHRFSLLELFEICIYVELKNIGFSIKSMLAVKERLNEQMPKEVYEDMCADGNYFEPTSLGFWLSHVLSGKNIFLVTDSSVKKCHMLPFEFICSIVSGEGLDQEYYKNGSSLVLISFRKILDRMKVTYPKKHEKFIKLIDHILTSPGNEDIKISLDEYMAIRNISIKKYRKFNKSEGINDLINTPNQKTTIHSNNNGGKQIVVEKKLS